VFVYGVGVGSGVGTAGTLVGADGSGVSAALLTSTVGGTMVAGVGRGAPVNKKTVPKTMLSATRPFSPIDAYQRQPFFCDLGFTLLGIPNSFNFAG